MEPWVEMMRNILVPRCQPKQCFLGQAFHRALWIRCTAMLKIFHTEVIETNIRMYERGRTSGENFQDKQTEKCDCKSLYGVIQYEMKKLSESEEVFRKSKLKKTMALNIDSRAEVGSFAGPRKK
jgi:hypothetical protein